MLANDVKVKALIKSFVNKQDEGQYPSTCKYQHHIHTPFELCAEILQQIPAGKYDKYLVMFNVEFVYELNKLVDFGTSEVYYYTTNTALAELAKKLCPLVKIVDEIEDMKFDVIVGNPPYQRGDGSPNSHALWEEFVEKSHSVVQPGGLVALITPLIGRRKVSKLFAEKDVLVYSSETVKHHFPGVGSTFCWHIVRNSKAGVETTVINKASTLNIKLPKYGFFPSFINEDNIKFLEKVTSGEKLDIRTNMGIHSSNATLFSAEESSLFPYKYQHTSSQTKYGAKPCAAMQIKKVVCSKSGYLKPWYDDTGIGVTEGSFVIPVDSEAQANNIIKFLTSDIVARFKELSGSNSSANDPNTFKLMCMPQEEIDYIELTVK